ncbi:MAG: hypothetical protein R2795_21920 [Saprospiraceae bacterium]
MRGDMSHVQMRPEGVPPVPVPYYDPLGEVKKYIQQEVPWFGYFAESFLAPPGVMAYGDEVAHLEASFADTTLGDLQSMVPGSELFMTHFSAYWDVLQNSRVAPNFTVMTGDKDDPRFDAFYLHGNEARLFTALFLPDMPSYQALGFEQRDPHPVPAPNEYYTKLYVFCMEEGEKATHGPYQWGQNGGLFDSIQRIRAAADQCLPVIQNTVTRWLLPPNPATDLPVIAWTTTPFHGLLFLQNYSATQAASMTIPVQEENATWECIFSTHPKKTEAQWTQEGDHLVIHGLAPGESWILRDKNRFSI